MLRPPASSALRRWLSVLGLALLASVGLFAQSAGAKVLPVTRIEVVTRQAQAGSPVRVVLQVDPASGFTGSVPAITRGEVVVVRAAEADADGWPLSGVRGRIVVLASRGEGQFRGSFVVQNPGSYFVVSQSSAIAHRMLMQQVSNAPRNLPAPVAVRVRG